MAPGDRHQARVGKHRFGGLPVGRRHLTDLHRVAHARRQRHDALGPTPPERGQDEQKRGYRQRCNHKAEHPTPGSQTFPLNPHVQPVGAPRVGAPRSADRIGLCVRPTLVPSRFPVSA